MIGVFVMVDDGVGEDVCVGLAVGTGVFVDVGINAENASNV
jgi:hypothetical protein